MFGITGYLSKYKGAEVDATVERVQGLDSELALKVDKTATINGHEIGDGVVLTAEELGALSSETSYGKKLLWENEMIYLLDQNGVQLSNAYVQAAWGKISGDLANQEDLSNALSSKQPMIDSENMLSSDLVDDTDRLHRFATASQLSQIATNTSNISTNTGDISTINGKIPSQASSENQLADKNFVNSSIATNTSYFIGTFNSVADLEAYSGTLTNNDYAFVVSVDSAGNTVYNRYKYTTATTPASWQFEYALNNSSFTSNQWAAINSGANTTNIAQISTNANDISTINGTLASYGDIVTYNASNFATAAQGQKADTALQSINSTMVVNALGYTPYNSANPDGFISGIDSSMVVNALGYTPYNSTNPDGFISGINSSDVTTALGYTPYNSTNPDGFISSAAISSLTDVNLVNLGNGDYLKYDSTANKWVNSAAVSLAWGNITGTLADQTDLQNALNGKEPTITGAASTVTSSDLTANRALISDSNGKIAVSSINTTKLGYLSDVTSNIQVQLNEKISSAAVNTLTDVTLTNLGNGDYLKYDSSSGKWINVTSSAISPIWGNITGTLADQTDLQNALNGKEPTITGAATTVTSSDLTADRVLVSSSAGKIEVSTIPTTKLGYLTDVTSNIQAQINNKISSASISSLTDVTLTNLGNGNYLKYDSSSGKWVNSDAVSLVWGNITGDLADQTDLTNALNGKEPAITGAATSITSNDLTASMALVSDSSGKVAASSISATKLGYLTDVTSNIQAQLNNKISSAAISNLTDVTLTGLGDGNYLKYDSASGKWKNTSLNLTSALEDLSDVDITNPSQGQNLVYDSVSDKWINATASATVGWGGITGTLADQTDLQNALNGKEPTITGAATSITSNDLTASVVLVSDIDGKVAASSISTSKLGYLSDVTSSIQAQLNSKISSAAVSSLTDVTLTNLADGNYLKYDSASGKWKNTSLTITSALDDLSDVTITNPSQGQNLVYDSANNKWINASSSATVGWGGITGDINDQTDLKNVLDSKASVTFRNWSS